MADTDDHDGGWITYAEAAALLGITAEAVRTRARRYGWPRMRPNLPGGHARVRLPEQTAPARPRPAVPGGRPPSTDGQPTGAAPVSDQASNETDRAVAAAIDSLRTQLDRQQQTIEWQREEIARLHNLLVRQRRWRRWFR
jgi:hypothetical protein